MACSQLALLICCLLSYTPSFPLASGHQIDFVASVYLLVGFLFVVIFGGIITLAIVVFIRCRRREKAVADETERARLSKLRPDGEPYPPSGRGMCDACGRAFDKVYFLADGRRLCEKCYASTEMPAYACVRPANQQEPS